MIHWLESQLLLTAFTEDNLLTSPSKGSTFTGFVVSCLRCLKQRLLYCAVQFSKDFASFLAILSLYLCFGCIDTNWSELPFSLSTCQLQICLLDSHKLPWSELLPFHVLLVYAKLATNIRQILQPVFKLHFQLHLCFFSLSFRWNEPSLWCGLFDIAWQATVLTSTVFYSYGQLQWQLVHRVC